MRKMVVIAAREYQSAVKTKAFIIGIVALPIIWGAMIGVQFLLKDKVDIKEKRFAVLDYTGQIFDAIEQAVADRNAKDIFVNAQVNVIPPGTADVARYRVIAPPGAATVRARLLWRKFNHSYTEFTFSGQEVPELPITEIASATAQLPDVDRKSWKDWTRHNDLGIGLLRQGDTGGTAFCPSRLSGTARNTATSCVSIQVSHSSS